MALSAHDTSSAEIRSKRISIELESLKQLPEEFKVSSFETALGLYIRIQFDPKAVKEEEQKETTVNKKNDKYIFDVLLDHKYPFQQPQIFSRSAFNKLAINDGRDLFNDVLRGEWRISQKIINMIQYIPDFISEISEESYDEMKVVGNFHLGYLYEMSNWGTNGMNRDSRIFNCEEQDEYDEETFYQRYLVITKSAFLLLEPYNKAKNLGMLQAWATLQSLDKLRRNLNRPELVTFVWRQIEGKQPWVLNLLVNKHEECISTLVSNMQNMGVGVEKNIKTQTKIRESEVTKEAIARMDIEQILEHIAAYESAIENDLSLSTVQTVNSLYQKAVEYYSAFDDLLYNEYLHRSQILFQRPDIQAVLSSMSSSSPTLPQEQPKKKQQIDFDIDGDDDESSDQQPGEQVSQIDDANKDEQHKEDESDIKIESQEIQNDNNKEEQVQQQAFKLGSEDDEAQEHKNEEEANDTDKVYDDSESSRDEEEEKQIANDNVEVQNEEKKLEEEPIVEQQEAQVERSPVDKQEE